MKKANLFKILVGMLSVFALVVVFNVANAADDVSITPHNLSITGTGNNHLTAGTNSDKICVFCHTPHSSVSAPLWNRNGSTVTTYDMYDGTYSTTMDMTVAATPGSVSLACLSCHDGTLALGTLVNNPGNGLTGDIAGWTWNNVAISGSALVGTVAGSNNDLRTEHPVGVTYDETLDTAFNAPSGTYVGTLPLYSGSVECGSCHNPHDGSNGSFLRVSNAASALCTTCHIK